MTDRSKKASGESAEEEPNLQRTLGFERPNRSQSLIDVVRDTNIEVPAGANIKIRERRREVLVRLLYKPARPEFGPRQRGKDNDIKYRMPDDLRRRLEAARNAHEGLERTRTIDIALDRLLTDIGF
jgi:hypothetical protein